MSIGYVIDGPEGVLKQEGRVLDGTGTNNVAEYTALIEGLKAALDAGVKDIRVRGDSNLVVQQLLGKFRVRQPRLRPLHQEVSKLASEFESIEVQWIPRENNTRADALANKALDAKEQKKRALGSKPSEREHSILCSQCGKPCTIRIQTFKDGSEHLRQECPEHGFVGYAPETPAFRKLADSNR